MSVSESFLKLVLDLMTPFGEIRSRKMFGGVSIYLDDVIVALLDDDRFYLKVDDQTRPLFESQGFKAFQPYGPEGGPMSYNEYPVDWLEDTELSRHWVELALEAALRKKTKRNR